MKMNIMQQNLLSLLPLWSSVGPRLVISSIFLRLQDQAAPLSTSQIHSLISKSQKSSGELVTAFTAITFSKQWDNGTKKVFSDCRPSHTGLPVIDKQHINKTWQLCWKILLNFIFVAFVSCHNMKFFDIWNEKAFYSLFHGQRNHKIHLMNVEIKCI